MRKLTYFVACSLDGFIARRDGSFDFALPEGEHLRDLVRRFPETMPGHLRGPLGVTSPNQYFDAVLMGRATYEVGLRLGVTSPYPHLEQYVFSRTMAQSPDPQVQLVREDPIATVRRLKGGTGRDLWLCGGGQLAAALFTEIDELILKINPAVLGAGIPLFAAAVPGAVLELVDSQAYVSGFVLVRYRLRRRPADGS